MGQVPSGRVLRLSAVKEWRPEDKGMQKGWEKARLAVLSLDDYTCYYCGFRCKKYMHVHHLEGKHYDDSPENLVTLCPICHSCLHIGHAGINSLGSLLLLESEADQAWINRSILEGTDAKILYDTLPTEADFGPEGLVELANMILRGFEPDGRFVLFPNPEKYAIIKYLKGKSK